MPYGTAFGFSELYPDLLQPTNWRPWQVDGLHLAVPPNPFVARSGVVGADIFETVETSQNIRWPRCAEIVVAARQLIICRPPLRSSSSTCSAGFTGARPFLDKGLAPLIGYNSIAPMDHRMVEKTSDWCIRLPLVTAVLPLLQEQKAAHRRAHRQHHRVVRPHARRLGLHVLVRAARVHICRGALLAQRPIRSRRSDHPALRAELIVLYFSAAFWKLTSSWFDMHYSCATVLMSELLAGMEPMLPFVKHLSVLLLHAAPNLVAGIEFAVPTFLLLRPRWGVLLARLPPDDQLHAHHLCGRLQHLHVYSATYGSFPAAPQASNRRRDPSVRQVWSRSRRPS